MVLTSDDSRAGAVLACDAVGKRFGGLTAVRDLDFHVRGGEIFGIAGPNGAGKTTLFNLISGHAAVTSGHVHFRGRDVTGASPDVRFRMGLARTFQAPLAFSTESVLDNVRGGAFFGRRRRGLPLRMPGWATQGAEAALELVGLTDRRARAAGTLSVFDRKRLMIASALAAEPTVLMLDEPVGGLNASELEQLVGVIRRVNATGVTVLLIEHVLKVLFELCDRALVMQHGAAIFEGTPDEVARDEGVIRSYLGTSIPIGGPR